MNAHVWWIAYNKIHLPVKSIHMQGIGSYNIPMNICQAIAPYHSVQLLQTYLVSTLLNFNSMNISTQFSSQLSLVIADSEELAAISADSFHEEGPFSTAVVDNMLAQDPTSIVTHEIKYQFYQRLWRKDLAYVLFPICNIFFHAQCL